MLRIERLSPDGPGACCGCSPPASGSTTSCSPTPSGLDRRALREALREAVAAQLAVTDDEGRYAFRHALLREVVDDDLLPGERADAAPRAGARRWRSAPEARRRRARTSSAAIAHHYRLAGDQPAALRGVGPRRGGRRAASTPTARRRALLERAMRCGTAWPTPRRWPAPTTSSCCAPRGARPRVASATRAPEALPRAGAASSSTSAERRTDRAAARARWRAAQWQLGHGGGGAGHDRARRVGCCRPGSRRTSGPSCWRPWPRS